MGFLDVDAPTVGNAVAGETMFIHGSLTGGGGTQFSSPRTKAVATAAAAQSRLAAASPPNRLGEGGEPFPPHSPAAADCKPACGSPPAGEGEGEGAMSMSMSMSTVCDRASCSSPGGWLVGEEQCGAGDEDLYGRYCRSCYLDEHEALQADRLLEAQARQAGHEAGQHVIMCDTLRPPQSADCSRKCATKVDTVSTAQQVYCCSIHGVARVFGSFVWMGRPTSLFSVI